MAVGSRCNTKVELLALQGLLWLKGGIFSFRLRYFGTQGVTIYWDLEKAQLHAFHLDRWLKRARLLIAEFSEITLQHVYKETNSQADTLSKQVIRPTYVYITFGHLVEFGTYVVFQILLVHQEVTQFYVFVFFVSASDLQ